MASTLAPAELFTLESLVTPTAQGIASRVLARTSAGNITLFAFDAGEEFSEHTAPFDALALTLSGALIITIGGVEVRTVVRTNRGTRGGLCHAAVVARAVLAWTVIRITSTG